MNMLIKVYVRYSALYLYALYSRNVCYNVYSQMCVAVLESTTTTGRPTTTNIQGGTENGT